MISDKQRIYEECRCSTSCSTDVWKLQLYQSYNYNYCTDLRSPKRTVSEQSTRCTSSHFIRSISTNDQIPIDQAPYTSNIRSPSPLFEVDETPSPELTELQHPRRRASESYSSTPRGERSSSKRRGFSMSIPQDRSRLDPDEKANRAAAAEGLNKGDKRRMQNKLAQRAFRARSKIVNKHVSGSFSHRSSLFSSLMFRHLRHISILDEHG